MDFLLHFFSIQKLETLYRYAQFRAFAQSLSGAEVMDFDYAERPQYYRRVADLGGLGDCAIDYLEFGVFQGESIKCFIEINKHPDSRFFGFDTFTGLPEDWNADFPSGTFNVGGVAPQVNDKRCRFIVGKFEDTFPSFFSSFDPRNKLVVHIDSDLYSAALLVLTATRPLLRPGSIVMFDEFSDLQHEFAAWQEFNKAFKGDWVPLVTRKNLSRVSFRLRAV